MSFKHIRIVIIGVLMCILGLPLLSNAQSSGISPYSSYGVGDINNQNGVMGFSMGQTGIALHDNDSSFPFFVNLKNPASYAFNRPLTTFEAGMLNNNVNFTTEGQSYKNSNTYFGYFAMVFPLAKHWGASLGMRPFSSVGYNLNVDQNVDSIGTVTNQYQGTGGINQAHFGLAYELGKHLSFGVNASYLFGNISNIENVVYSPNMLAFNSQRTESTDIKSLYFNYGMMFSHKLWHDWNITVGGTLALASNINATYNRLAITYANGTPQYNIDTIQDSTVKGSIRLPLMIGGGITLNNDKWTFTFDYSMQNWSQYTYFGQSQNLADSKQLGFGLQYIPKKGQGNIFQRTRYRAGFSYNQTYLNLNNNQLNDYCLTLGLGVPIGAPFNPPFNTQLSYINLGIQLGRMGTTSNNLLQEDYIKIVFGFTFNSWWFQKRYYQ